MAEPSHPRPGLIDTDILIDALRGYTPAGEFIRKVQDSPFGITISSITAMELLVGCHDSAELRRITSHIEALRTIHITEAASARAIEWIRLFRLSHSLQIPDALIAACAYTSGLPLYTNNTKHFKMLPSLTIIRPY